MAKTVYVDGTYGDNANNGLSWATAKKTIVGARAATVTNDLVLIAPGVYKEPNQYFNSVNDTAVLYMPDPTKSGAVIVDFDFNQATIGGYNVSADVCNWHITRSVRFLNLAFRNPHRLGSHCMIGAANLNVFHCLFYTEDGPGNLGNAFTQASHLGGLGIYNCTFYNLWRCTHRCSVYAYNNYFVGILGQYFYLPYGTTRDYNAYPGNTEANGINTATGANPGFRDAAAQDFRLDPATSPADYTTFMGGGQYGNRIGATGRGGLYYNVAIAQLRFLTPDPLPAAGNPQPIWENEGPSGTNTYTDGTPGDVIENSTTKELEIDLATTPTATGGRVRSDVMDLGSTSPNLDEIALGAAEDLVAGAAVDVNTTLPQHIEYRSSNTAFAKGDASPSWVTTSRFGEYVNQGHRYFQIRVTLRTDHTNV